jgi:Rieske Fe-S protein
VAPLATRFRESIDMPLIARREFLARMVGAVTGGIAALLGIPAAVFVIGPSQQRTTGEWVTLGSVDEFPLDVPKLVNATVTKQSGWVVEPQELSVFVSTADGTDFTAMSDRCTHLACRVRYVEQIAETEGPGFFCPCHNGIFDASGGTVAGPVPRPLDRLETKIEEGELFVRGP